MDALDADGMAQLEDRFLADLQKRPVPIDSLLGTLRFVRASGQQETAENWAQTLKETLIESGEGQALLRLCLLWSRWRGDSRAFGAFCHEVLAKVDSDRLWAACVNSVGFGELAPSESLRRLTLLLACRPGTFCMDKTWGFGVVKRMDDFYKRMVVDFTLKPNHVLSLAYAAETLVPVDENHLLARRHRHPDKIEQLAREHPAEIVRMALRDFGPLSANRLESLLTDQRIVNASQWKRFWEAARKELKSDPLVELPSRRTEPLVLRDSAKAYDSAWFETLKNERDTDRIVRSIRELEEATDPSELDDAAREVLANRLAFAAKGAYNTQPALYARLALLVDRWGLERPDLSEMRKHLRENNRFLRASETLTARECGGLARMLLADADAAPQLLEALPRMNYNMLAESLEAMRKHDEIGRVQKRCRELLAATSVPPALLVWTLRHHESLVDWPLPALYELMAHAIAIVEDNTLSGEDLRMQKQLTALFEQAKWFAKAFLALSDIQRAALFDRIFANQLLWDPTTQRTIIGRMIKHAPGLADRKHSGNANTPSAPAMRWTSWRSLRERQAQFRKLVEEEIPANSHDIAVARSYGDLRENFEFQSAKQQQAILLQRRDEWDRDLKQVRGTNFSDVGTDKIGMGVQVRLQHADGHEQVVAILGEWDRDEQLGILPNLGRLAQTLDGHKAGDQVSIPGPSGDEIVTVRAVEPLREEIRAWLEQDVSAATTG